MPTFRITGGTLTGTAISSNYPDNTLPGYEWPVDPGYGISGDRPSNPIVLPPAPPGIWPPPSIGNPIAPVDPGFGGGIPVPPGTIWPSPNPPRPDNTLPGGGLHPGGGPMPGGDRPDNTLPQPPGQIDNTLPSRTFWMLCYCPALGWRYVSVDPSLRPGMPLPPTAEPKPVG